MPVTWNFLDAFKFAIDRKDKDRQRLEKYLDDMVQAADEMVGAWKHAHDLLKVEHRRLDELRSRLVSTQLATTPNPNYHQLINNAYRNSTPVIAGKMDSMFHEALKHSLAVLLQQRLLSLQVYHKLLDGLKLKYFSIASREVWNADILQDCIEQMERAAGDLKSLVSEFKAKQ
jgi:hypothetical protein